ncbi:MAG TPA: HAD family phosphatase [Ktedonobacterales bacterium]|nr:HAD family phosphatase [Ktedonobacterales bacterium]
MPIRAIVFDIGGVLEVTPGGVEPTTALPTMIARWDARLYTRPGELEKRLRQLDERLKSMGKDGALGTCSEEEWVAELRFVTGMDAAQADAFMRDFWDVYLGALNVELATYFAGLRPRYRTAILSNSFAGAREKEQERYGFGEMCDLIVYSHEEGMQKPERRIYELTCERLGVRPEEVVFLDDAEVCVAGARALGMHAVLLRDTAQAIAEIDACLRAHAL